MAGRKWVTALSAVFFASTGPSNRLERCPAMNRNVLLSLAVMVLSLAGLAGCAQKIPLVTTTEAGASDIHERLSYTIRRHGFRHGIMSNREDNRDIDSIFVSVPLDGLKRQHPGLERMLTAVGTICALPEYADVPVRVELGTMDEADLKFMRNIFEKTLAGKTNAEIVSVSDSRSDLTITVPHIPVKKPR